MRQLDRSRASVAGVVTEMANEVDWDLRFPLKVTCPSTRADFVTIDRFRLEDLRRPMFGACLRCGAVHELDLSGVVSEEILGNLIVVSIRRADGTIFRTPDLGQRPAQT